MATRTRPRIIYVVSFEDGCVLDSNLIGGTFTGRWPIPTLVSNTSRCVLSVCRSAVAAGGHALVAALCRGGDALGAVHGGGARRAAARLGARASAGVARLPQLWRVDADLSCRPRPLAAPPRAASRPPLAGQGLHEDPLKEAANNPS